MIVLADVIFPVFWAPYVAPFFWPGAWILAISAEIGVFLWLNPHLNIRTIIVLVVLANVASALVGCLLTAVLPSGWIPKVVNMEGHDIQRIVPGPYFTTYFILAFFIAFVLSVVIEYGVVRLAARSVKVIKPFVTVTLANLASYIVLILSIFLLAVFRH